MQWLPGFTDFFMSPVTGRINLSAFPDLTDDYIWIGDPTDRPIASPIIIDLRLEIVDLRRRLSETRFILQAPSENFDSSQALNELDNGILKHDEGVVEIAVPGTDYMVPSLTYKNVWIGDATNKPAEFPRIQVENLPTMASTDPDKLLGAYNLYAGSSSPLSLGEPEIILRINITNLPDLTVGKLWYGTNSSNPLNFGSNRPVEIQVLPITNMADLATNNVWVGDGSNRPVASPTIPISVLPNLTTANVWVGDGSNRPVASATIPISVLPDLPTDNVWVGNGSNRPVPSTVIPGGSLPDLTSTYIWIGNVSNRPVASPHIEIGNLPDLPTDNFWVGDGTNRPVPVTVIPSGALPDLASTNIWIGDGTNRPVASPHIEVGNLPDLTETYLWLGNLLNRPVQVPNIEIENLPPLTWTYIWRGDITGRPQESFDLTNMEIFTIPGIQADIVAINASIAVIEGEILILQGQVTALEGTVGGLVVTVGGLVTAVSILQTQVIALGTRIDDLRLNTIPADADVSFYNFKIIDLADPVNPTDGANKAYVDSAIAAGTIVLTGNVTGSGVVGTPVVTTLNMTLDTIPLAVANVNLNTHKLINVVNPTAAQDAATKNYVDTSIAAGTIVLTGNVTGSGVVGTPFATTLALSLDQIPLAAANVNINTHKLINVVNPTAAQDAATKNYVDTAIAAGTIVLTGNVTGSGVVGTPFATTLALSLDQITVAAANVNLNSHKITNLSTPTAGTDAANKTYVDSAIAAGTIVLTGNVTGSGVVGTPFATTLVLSLDQITVAAANVNLNSHKITNLSTPTTGTDAANKSYVDSAIAAGTITLTGAVTGSGVVGTPFATALSQVITVGGVNQNFNFSDPISLFVLKNSFVPTSLNSSNLYLDFMNNAPDGYRFRQTTTFGGSSAGNFFLDKVIATTPTNLMNYDNTANAFTFVPNTNFSGTVFCNGSAPALKFPNSTLSRKISLYETAANDHQYFGFGVNTASLRYQVDATTSDHVFYAGLTSSTSQEVARVTGTGNVIIPGTSYSTIIHGSIGMVGNATGFTANNTWTKVAGTTTLITANEFTMPSNNRLTYTGTTHGTIKAMLSATISWTYNSLLSDDIYFSFYKNGSALGFYLPYTSRALGGYQISALERGVTFTTNDYFEIWAFSTGGSTITVWGLSLNAIRL